MNKLTFITLGEAAVGKTTFAKSATEERACTETSTATVGMDHFHRKFNYDGKVYTINLRDTAGSERFRSITQQFIRGCDGAFLMFDKEHRLIADLEYWRTFYETFADNPEWVLVKTKCDSQNKQERNMECRLHVLFSKIHEKPFFEVSAREYKGVEEALEALVTRVLHRRRLINKKTTDLDRIILSETGNKKNKKCNCL